jgi:hypothetical protein
MWIQPRAGLVRRLRCIRDRRVMAAANAGVSMRGAAGILAGTPALEMRMPAGRVVAVRIVVVVIVLQVLALRLRAVAGLVAAGQLRVVAERVVTPGSSGEGLRLN